MSANTVVDFYSNSPSEVDVLELFIAKIEEAVSDAIELVNEAGDDAPPKAIAWANTQINKSIDDTFNFTKDDPDNANQEISTPVILAEIDRRTNTKENATGRRMNGQMNFNFSVLVAREGRPFATYKKEVEYLVNGIEDVFKSFTDKKVVVGDISFSDFNWLEARVSGAVIPMVTYIGHYDFSITNNQ